MGAVITSVQAGSVAAKAGLSAGDELISVNGHGIRDCLDYQFYTTEAELELICRNGEAERSITIRKEQYEDIGLEFETYLMDKPQACHNHCIFCFIDQLPKGMRPTMYFKDDDTRLSFLTGNYVTLTNVSEAELDRICSQRISPINISVHVTDGERRKEMLRHPKAGMIMEQMKKLAEHHIEMNCQIVLCKGVNDGEYLKRSVHELSALYPAVNSISVVPVGLSRHRQGLYRLESFTSEDCANVIDSVTGMAENNLARFGSHIVFLSDEFYLKAGRALPEEEAYEGYPQLENGVGLMRSMQQEFEAALEDLSEAECESENELVIATGLAACDYMRGMVDAAINRCHNLKVQVYGIVNRFFGEEITVVGLITGRDLLEQMKGRCEGKKLLICSSMLRDEGDRFLDDVTTQQVEQALSVQLLTCDNNGYDLLDHLLGR